MVTGEAQTAKAALDEEAPNLQEALDQAVGDVGRHQVTR